MARSSHLFPYGIGPALDGLFVQSSLGIVTAIGIWLMPEPEAYSFFICSLERDEDIAAFVDDLRPLRLDGTVRSVIHLGNDLRVISGGVRAEDRRVGKECVRTCMYPWGPEH